MSERRLLIVDDEESFRKITARELERTGYAVSAAANLGQAREALAAGSFHVVLLDVRMPDGGGLDLLPEIRESFPGTDVVMLTAYGTVQEAIQAMKEGAHDFLTKPCKLAELEAVLLSPACSSYDMFSNYEERGERFRALAATEA